MNLLFKYIFFMIFFSFSVNIFANNNTREKSLLFLEKVKNGELERDLKDFVFKKGFIDEELISLNIPSGVNLFHTDDSKKTAAMWSIEKKYTLSTYVLLKRMSQLDLKKSIKIKNKKGKDVWSLGLLSDSQKIKEITIKEIVHTNDSDFFQKYLWDRILKANFKFNDGSFLIHEAAKGGRFNIVILILFNNVDPNLKDRNGDTPLRLVLRQGKKGDVDENLLLAIPTEAKLESAKLLLNEGANPVLENNDGETAYDLSKEFKYREIKKIMEGNKFLRDKILELLLILEEEKRKIEEEKRRKKEQERRKREEEIIREIEEEKEMALFMRYDGYQVKILKTKKTGVLKFRTLLEVTLNNPFLKDVRCSLELISSRGKFELWSPKADGDFSKGSYFVPYPEVRKGYEVVDEKTFPGIIIKANSEVKNEFWVNGKKYLGRRKSPKRFNRGLENGLSFDGKDGLDWIQSKGHGIKATNCSFLE